MNVAKVDERKRYERVLIDDHEEENRPRGYRTWRHNSPERVALLAIADAGTASRIRLDDRDACGGIDQVVNSASTAFWTDCAKRGSALRADPSDTFG